MVGGCFGQRLRGSRPGATLSAGGRGSAKLRTSKSPSTGSRQRWKPRSSTTIEETTNCPLPVIFADAAGLCLSARLQLSRSDVWGYWRCLADLATQTALEPLRWCGIVTTSRKMSPVTFGGSDKCDRSSLARIPSGGAAALSEDHTLSRLTNPTGLAVSLHSLIVFLPVLLLTFARPQRAVLHVPEVPVSGLR